MEENKIKYGRLSVIGNIYKRFPKPNSKQRHSYVICRCDCGSVEKEYMVQSLKNGDTSSCGCLWKESITTHNLTSHPIYKCWDAIKQRCGNKKHASYKNYGGRGIFICNEWKNNFQSFYNWAIKNGWSHGLEIDRENNNGNYEPSNCRFISSKANSRNRRTTKITEEIANEIRSLRADGKLTHSKIAHAYSISRTNVSNILRNERWA